ncbi:MAG: FMN-binding protein [Pseudolysinimonas sp.]
MRRRAAIASVIASAGVVLVAMQIGSAVSAGTATTSGTGTGATGGTSTPATSGSSSGSTGTAGSTGSTAAQDGTFTGTTEQTPFGPMQVAAVISGGKITDVKVLQRTNQGGRSVQISNQADPMLRTEVLQAQTANVSTIGGATYTSEGYLMSLQSALDKAGFTG